MKGKWVIFTLSFLVTIMSTSSAFCAPKNVQQKEKEEKEDVSTPATKLETFLSKKGILLIKDFHYLGAKVCKPGGGFVDLNTLKIYEPGKENLAVKGLKLEISKEESRLKRSQAAFLDIDEAESLSKSIKYMIDLGNKWKGQAREYTEVLFSTKGNFSIGFFRKEAAFPAFISIGRIGELNCFMESVEDLQIIGELVDRGIDHLRRQ